jgi:VanZ family protein
MSPRLQHRLTFFARVLTLLYTIAICYLSLIPSRDLPLNNVSDKYRHAAAYAVFAVLLGCSFVRLRYWTVPLAFSIASLMGIGMEYTQPYFGRSRDVYDAMANSIGAGLGCVLVCVMLIMLTPRPSGSLSRYAE